MDTFPKHHFLKNTGFNKVVNILVIKVSHLKNKDELLLKAQMNHMAPLVRKMPTEINNAKCSAEKFCCKTGDG